MDSNWTAQPHWTVVKLDAGERMSVLHFETKAEAEAAAREKRRSWKGPMQSVSVEEVR